MVCKRWKCFRLVVGIFVDEGGDRIETDTGDQPNRYIECSLTMAWRFVYALATLNPR